VRVEASQDPEGFLDAFFPPSQALLQGMPVPSLQLFSSEEQQKGRVRSVGKRATELQQKAFRKVRGEEPRRFHRLAKTEEKCFKILPIHSECSRQFLRRCGEISPTVQTEGELFRGVLSEEVCLGNQRQLQGEMLFEGCRGGDVFPELLVVEVLVLDGRRGRREDREERVLSDQVFQRGGEVARRGGQEGEAPQEQRQGKKGQFRCRIEPERFSGRGHGHTRWCF
jgi:hypothetical protein